MTKVLNDDALTVFPSPTTMRSMVYFDVPATGTAKLSLYDACGRLVSVLADGRLGEGHHSVVFDASELPSGAYHVALITERGIATMQVPVIR